MNTTVSYDTLVQNNEEQSLEKLSNEDFISIIEAKTKINSKILNVLSNENLSKDHKSLLINMLTENANQSSLLLKIIRDSAVEDVEMDKIFPVNANKENKFLDKFKNMFAGFKADLSPSTFFKNNTLPNWREIGKISVLNIKPSFLNNQFVKNFTEFLASNVENSKVFVKQSNHNIYLIGQKYKIKKLYNQYKDIFGLLSVSPENFLEPTKQNEYNEKQLISDINQHLINKLSMNFNSSRNHYEFNLLNGLNDSLKFEMLSTIIAPEVINQLSKNYQVRESLEIERNNNKYISMVNEFSSKYNLNPILVIHALKEESSILSGYDGYEKLKNNKENILTANNDYELLLKKNIVYINELLISKNSILNSLSDIKIEQQSKDEFIENLNSQKMSIDGNGVSLKEFENTISKLIEDEQLVSINKKSVKLSTK